MTLRFYTFTGRHSGRHYYATAHTQLDASHKLGIKLKHLILEKSELVPPQLEFPSIKEATK